MVSCKKHKNKGSITGLILIISIIVTILGMSMLAVGQQVRIKAVRTTEQVAARVAADAGLTVGIQTFQSQYESGSIDENNLPAVKGVSLPNSDGTYSYAVTKNGSDYTITSTGNYRGSQKQVSAVFGVEGMTYDYALLTDGAMIFRNSSKIDWYNNKKGSSPLKVGTNATNSGALMLYNSSFINGDLVVGAGGIPGVVIKNKGGKYTGSSYEQTENAPMPSVNVPGYLSGDTSKGNLNKNKTLTSSNSGKYNTINLGNSEKIEIKGNVELYITGDITLGNSAEIEILEGGSLTIYVDGDVEGKNSSKFTNKTEDAKKFKLMCTDACSNVVMKNSGDMYGILYAPNADIELHNSATFWGSVVGKTCDMDNSSTLYYDASLQEYNEPILSTMKLKSWSE